MAEVGRMRFTAQIMPAEDLQGDPEHPVTITDEHVQQFIGWDLDVDVHGGVGVVMGAKIVAARVEDGWVVADIECTAL